MSRPVILAWVCSVCAALRRSQAKTLAELVAAAVSTVRATLANLGRAMAGPARCKHRIKRAGRFVANRRVTVADGMAGVIKRLTRRKDVPLVVSLDWVEVRNFHTLVAAAVAGGRSIPLLWATYPEWELAKSQNNLEEGLIRLLRSLVSDRVRIILLADRGFGRAELACTLLGLVHVSFVIRIKPQVRELIDRANRAMSTSQRSLCSCRDVRVVPGQCARAGTAVAETCTAVRKITAGNPS